MQIQILDLDGSLLLEDELRARHEPSILRFADWGPHIRMACSFGRFRRFEQALSAMLAATHDAGRAITLCGSGDFHHVSLALVRRLHTPINLLVVDNHPDWMRGVPFLHCGTWLYHAARLPHVARVFHLGGNVDFDNYYRWMAPWPLLRSGKIAVFPAIRQLRRGRWSEVPNEPLRRTRATPLSARRLEALLTPLRQELRSRPLYISLDKDVMVEKEAVVNWDSGFLTLAEVGDALEVFIRESAGNFAGMDIVGDWSPVKLRGFLRHVTHFTEHPALKIDPEEAGKRNQQTNLGLLKVIQRAVQSARRQDAGSSGLKAS